MPVLEIDGDVRLSQSGAIARYLANEAGLAGKSLRQKAVLDMMYETLYEILFKLPLSEPEGPEKVCLYFVSNNCRCKNLFNFVCCFSIGSRFILLSYYLSAY